MNRAIKYRAYPTTEQCILFAKTFGCCRRVWNLMLADKIAYYQEHQKTLQTTPAQYKKEYPYLKEVDSLALANVQMNLQTAYKNFFRDKKIGLPKYKSAKHSRKSYTTNNQKGTVAITDKGIKLPKVGFEYDTKELYAPVTSMSTLGLDYKSDGLYVDSDGNDCDMPHYYRLSQDILAKSQRKLKHKTVGSNNYRKQQRKIAKIHRHIANQRKDFLHKKSTEIANQYTCVCVESLNMRSMANKGFGNGKATLDNGYGMFVNFLEYKLKDRGGYLIKVDKWFPSSQLCHWCGYRSENLKDLRIRKWDCPHCGHKGIDRDWNSAINIKVEGLRILGSA